jgi:hypothetical protein
MAWLLLTAVPARAQQAEEYRVKAAFLYHFIQLIDWPPQGQGEEKKPITVCAFGKDPFDGDLEATLQGKTIGLRPLHVRHLKASEDMQACQVLFVPDGERKRVFLALDPLKNLPILTVGEDEDFVKRGGMIGFGMDGANKLRFDVNVDAASRAGLKVSSRLLVLARNVIGSHP